MSSAKICNQNKINNNKILDISYNSYIHKNKNINKLKNTIDLFNDKSLYDALCPLINMYSYTIHNLTCDDIYKDVIKYLNIYEENYKYLFNNALILKTIKNNIIEQNIINTIEFNKVLDVEKRKMQIFNPTYKFDLY